MEKRLLLSRVFEKGKKKLPQSLHRPGPFSLPDFDFCPAATFGRHKHRLFPSQSKQVLRKPFSAAEAHLRVIGSVFASLDEEIRFCCLEYQKLQDEARFYGLRRRKRSLELSRRQYGAVPALRCRPFMEICEDWIHQQHNNQMLREVAERQLMQIEEQQQRLVFRELVARRRKEDYSRYSHLALRFGRLSPQLFSVPFPGVMYKVHLGVAVRLAQRWWRCWWPVRLARKIRVALYVQCVWRGYATRTKWVTIIRYIRNANSRRMFKWSERVFAEWRGAARHQKRLRELVTRMFMGDKRKMFDKWKVFLQKKKEEKEAQRRKYARRFLLRAIGAAFMSWAEFAQRSLYIKGLMKNALKGSRQYFFDRWRGYVGEIRHEKMLHRRAVDIQRVFRGWMGRCYWERQFMQKTRLAMAAQLICRKVLAINRRNDRISAFRVEEANHAVIDEAHESQDRFISEASLFDEERRAIRTALLKFRRQADESHVLRKRVKQISKQLRKSAKAVAMRHRAWIVRALASSPLDKMTAETRALRQILESDMDETVAQLRKKIRESYIKRGKPFAANWRVPLFVCPRPGCMGAFVGEDCYLLHNCVEEVFRTSAANSGDDEDAMAPFPPAMAPPGGELNPVSDLDLVLRHRHEFQFLLIVTKRSGGDDPILPPYNLAVALSAIRFCRLVSLAILRPGHALSPRSEPMYIRGALDAVDMRTAGAWMDDAEVAEAQAVHGRSTFVGGEVLVLRRWFRSAYFWLLGHVWPWMVRDGLYENRIKRRRGLELFGRIHLRMQRKKQADYEKWLEAATVLHAQVVAQRVKQKEVVEWLTARARFFRRHLDAQQLAREFLHDRAAVACGLMTAMKKAFAYISHKERLHDIWLNKQHQSAAVIQAMFRSARARQNLKLLLSQLWLKRYDPETDKYYFVNIRTRERSDTPPKHLNASFDLAIRLVCLECDSRVATLSCADCCKPLCEGCSGKLHGSQNVRHRLVAVTSSLPICSQCESMLATVTCGDCDGELYCGGCYKKQHRKGRRRRHAWKKIDGPVPLEPIMQQMIDRRNMARDSAAKRLQKAWKGYKGRRMLEAMLEGMYLKRFDASSGCYFYVNMLSGASQWEKPALLKGLADIRVRLACSMCEAQRATFHCILCEAAFCDACFETKHKRLIRAHDRIKIVEKSQICCECEARMASAECRECKDVYCGACFVFRHQKGKRKLHAWKQISLKKGGCPAEKCLRDLAGKKASKKK